MPKEANYTSLPNSVEAEKNVLCCIMKNPEMQLDIIAQLKGKELGEELLLPVNVLRSGENVLLDDVTTQDISKALQVPVNIVKSSGYDFTETILGRF